MPNEKQEKIFRRHFSSLGEDLVVGMYAADISRAIRDTTTQYPPIGTLPSIRMRVPQ